MFNRFHNIFILFKMAGTLLITAHGNFTLKNQIGKKSFSKTFEVEENENVSVTLVQNISRHDLSTDPTLGEEIEFFQGTEHKYILQLEGCDKKVVHQEIKKVALFFELPKGGRLFDYLKLTGPLPERVVLTYFQQLIDGLHWSHSHGNYHRDLDLSCLMLSLPDFQLKIANFGLSVLHDAASPHYKLCSNKRFMAPETLGQSCEGAPADIFSCGVILFILLSGVPPFTSISNDLDLYWKRLETQNIASFWEMHKRLPQTARAFESVELMDLIVRMLHPVKEERITLDQIATHPWVNRQSLSCDELRAEMIGRYQQMKTTNIYNDTPLRTESDIIIDNYDDFVDRSAASPSAAPASAAQPSAASAEEDFVEVEEEEEVVVLPLYVESQTLQPYQFRTAIPYDLVVGGISQLLRNHSSQSTVYTNREERKIVAEIRIVGIITMDIQLYVDPLDNRFILVNCIHLNGDECSFFDIFCILRNRLTNQTVEIVFIDDLLTSDERDELD